MSQYIPKTVEPNKPRAVYLYGESPSLGGYRTLLNKAGIAVAGTIDAAPFADIPRVAKESAFSHRDIPIVVTRGTFHFIPPDLGTHERFLFFRNALAELPAEGCANQILHPSFVVEFVDVRLKNTAFVTGLPGSGNVLFQKIARALIERHAAADTEEDVLIKNVCQNFDYHLMAYLTPLLNGIGSSRIVETSYGVGFVNFYNYFGDEMANVCDIRSRRHFYRLISGAHHVLDGYTAVIVKRLKIPAFVCLRHPLDTYISSWHKAALQQQTIKGTVVDDVNAESLLREIGWSAFFYKTAFDACADLFLVRYEDMMTQPVETIAAIARHMDISISAQDAEALWDEFGMKPLKGTDEGHFRKAGLGGWKEVLDAGLLAAMRESGAFAVLKHFGYSLGEIAPVDRAALRRAKPLDPAGHYTERKDVQCGDSIVDTVWVECRYGFNAHGDDIRNVLDTDVFKRFCRSADYRAAGTS